MERKNLLIALPGLSSRVGLSEGLLALSSFSEGWAVHTASASSVAVQEGGVQADEGLPSFGEALSAEALALDAIAVLSFGSLGRAGMSTLSRNGVFAVILVDSGALDAVLLEYSGMPRFRFMPEGSETKPLAIAAAAVNLDSIKAAFSASEKRSLRNGESFQNLLKALPDFIYVLDKEGKFTYLNEAARSFGYEPESLIGRHFTEILHEDDRANVSRETVLARIRSEESFPQTPPKLFDERRSGSRMTRELEVRVIHGKTGGIIFGSVNAYGESVEDTALYSLSRDTGFVTMGAIRDITALRLYQTSLEKNLAEKELLLREIHHRVRNNLQVIASLAHLKELELPEGDGRKPFSELIAQIKSMAIVHEALYQTERLRGVATRDYFERFARLMVQTYGHIGSPIVLKVEAEDFFLEAEKLSYLGMIASEFVSSAYRYAFPDGRAGTISLVFLRLGDRVELKVSDDGVGLSSPMKGNRRFGMEIVEALAKQIGGSIERGSGQGTALKLTLPLA